MSVYERTLCTIGSTKFIKAMCVLHYFHIISIRGNEHFSNVHLNLTILQEL